MGMNKSKSYFFSGVFITLLLSISALAEDKDNSSGANNSTDLKAKKQSAEQVACLAKLQSVVGDDEWNDKIKQSALTSLCTFDAKRIMTDKFEPCFSALKDLKIKTNDKDIKSGAKGKLTTYDIASACRFKENQDLSQDSNYQYCLQNYSSFGAKNLISCRAHSLQNPKVVDCVREKADKDETSPLDSICPCIQQSDSQGEKKASSTSQTKE